MKKLFEPITDGQIKKIHTRSKEIKLSDERLYSMVEKLIGIASITALSKQAATHIIEREMGPTKWLKPPSARTEDEIPYDASNLPYLSHIIGIRLMAKEFGWDKDHLKNWLRKYMKVGSIRELDRKRARDAFVATQVPDSKRKS